MSELLIVDDNRDVAELLGEGLVRRGYQVRIANDGEEGLQQLALARPDAVLLDVEMPHLDGPGMAHQMLVRDCGLETIPIVLLSGMVDLKDIAAHVGTRYYLCKPYTFRAVIAMCERALAERMAPLRAIE